MKILDRYILTSFITTFATVFVILFFIFILQGIWLFIAELAGKDLDVWLIAKFLLFYSPKMIPLVLPLSILLASIMTFGNFAENYEFAAMKSSGISLSRAMRSLTVFIVGLSIVAFFFANDVIPKAEYKFINLRKSILQRKPAMAIAEGQFNAIGTFNIKVDKKSGENGEKLEGVTIHKRNQGAATGIIIRSKTGLLKSTEGTNLLQLELFDGYYYEEIRPDGKADLPFAKSSFSRQVINIDLTMLNSNDEDDEQIANTNTMLNVGELRFTLDSLETHYDKDLVNIANNAVDRIKPVFVNIPVVGGLPIKPVDSVAKKGTAVPADILSVVPTNNEKIRVLDNALSNLAGAEFPITQGKADLLAKTKNINNHWLALYDKFVIAYACLLMFFIGAPLGAIIRKGGLGLPIVFAVLIFIIFHFINTFGKKVAQENGIPPFLGAWMSSFVLSPLGIFLTYRATNDMNVTINFDWLTIPFQRYFIKQEPEGADKHRANVYLVRVNEDDEEWLAMKSLPDSSLIGIVKNARQMEYTPAYRNLALKALDLRGITQDDLQQQGNLYNVEYTELKFYSSNYSLYTHTALVLNILAFGAIALGMKKPLFVILAIVIAVLLYGCIFRAQKSLREIEKITNHKIGINKYVALILGFPFYIFTYFYNRAALKKVLSKYDYKF